MNSPGFRSLCALWWFFAISLSFLKAQPPPQSYAEVELTEIFKTLEQRYSVTFNFDPEAVKGYTYSGTLGGELLDESLSTLLAHTPFAFERGGKTVLIFLEEQKSYSLCGTLLDSQSNEPLAFANVVLEGRNRGVQSDLEGAFELQVKAHKDQRITFRYLGYSPLTVSVQAWKDSGCKTFSLKPEDLALDPILIQDYLLPGITEGKAYGAFDINFLRLSQNYSGQEHDVLKTVQILPGVTSADETASNLSIRGSTPDQNLILWEGATLYDPGHIFGMISSISPFVVDKIKIYKGVFAPHYDNRVGGIVDISLSDEIASKTRAGFGATLTEAHAFADVPVIKDKLSFLISGRKTLSDLLGSPTLTSYSQRVFQATRVENGQEEAEEEGVEIAQNLDYFDLNAKVLFKPNDKLLFKGAYFKSSNDFFYSYRLPEFSFQTEDQVAYSMESLSAEVSLSWNPLHQSTLSWVQSDYQNSYGFTLFDPEDSIFNFRFDFSNSIRDQKLSLSHSWIANSRITLTAGYVFDYKSVTFGLEENSALEEGFSDINETEGDYHDLYGTLTYKSKKLQLDVGLKSTYFEQAEAWLYSPRASLQLSLSPHIKGKLSIGQLYQFISQLREIGEDELIGIANIWVLSEADDERLQARKISVGGLYKRDGWLLDLDAYYHSTKGLASFSTPLGRGIDIEANGKSQTWGVDLLFKKQWKKWRLGLNYTWNQNDYLFTEISPFSFPAPNDIRHNLGLTQSFMLGDWELATTYQFRSGLPYSIPNGINQFTDEEGEDFYELSYGVLNNKRLPTYQRLDLGIIYRKNFLSTPLKVEASLSVLNLFNRENVFTRETLIALDEETDQPEPFVLEKSLLGITPLLMLRLYGE